MNLLTIDFETYYDKDYTLSKLTTEEYIRHPSFRAHGMALLPQNGTASWVPHDEIASALASIDWGKTAVICHHAQFDGLILSHHYGVKPAAFICTMSMARVPIPGCAPPVSVSLAKLVEHYGIGEKGDALPLSKGMRVLTPQVEAKIATYCCKDATLTWGLFKLLSIGFPPDELRLIDLTVRMFTDPVLRVDAGRLENYLTELAERKEMMLSDAGVTPDDLLSADKFVSVLESLNVAVEMKPGTNGLIPAIAKTDDFMKSLLEQEDDRVQAVAAARLGVKSTINETRTKRMIGIAERGPLPVYLNYWGAHTGRWSGGDKMNLQNLPHKSRSPLRESILAPEGHVLVVCDSAQIEARTLAWLARHTQLVEDFAAGVDIYTKMGEMVGASRPVGKVLILGLGYGMGAAKLQDTMARGPLGMPPQTVTLETCTQWVDTYRRVNAPIKALWREIDEVLRCMVGGMSHVFDPELRRFVPTSYGDYAPEIEFPDGTCLTYPELAWADDRMLYRSGNVRHSIYGGKAVENIVQKMARGIIAAQMLTIAERYRVVTMTHDEIVAAVPESEAESALSFMLEAMSAAPSWAAGLPLAAEGGYAKEYSK